MQHEGTMLATVYAIYIYVWPHMFNVCTSGFASEQVQTKKDKKYLLK
jgi:hypothetical protein